MRILIIEDEQSLALQIKGLLESEKYTAEVSFTGPDGLEKALTEAYDLIILDVMLPGMDGFDLLSRIRREQILVPVLMLTAKDRTEDKVRGLDKGADDYLTKPFAIPELLARIRSLLRRGSEVKTTRMKIKDLEVDSGAHTVWRNGRELNLTPKEYAIFEFLLFNKNRVVSRLSIAEHVWGDNFDMFSMTNFVDVHVKNLRKKLNDQGTDGLIQTVRGVGYIIRDKE